MNRYQRIKKLGDGTYGEVYLAQISETNEIVAIKKMKRKYYSWDECLKLREIEALRKLNHPNIVKLKEVIRENDELYMIFEYMKENLYDYLKRKVKMNNATVKHVTYQMLQGLKAMHQKGFFHRDMKPENMLLNDNGQDPPTVKIADFGLARNIRSKPPYTDYVSTRWYRAPEVLLQSRNYSAPIDVWAVGCIVAELFTGRPLFPGSSEIDQLHKICSVIGTFTQSEWPEGVAMMNNTRNKFPAYKSVALETLIPTAEPDAISLIEECLKWNPVKRSKAADLLNCSWFSNMKILPSASTRNNYGPMPSKTAEGRRPTMQPSQNQYTRNAQTHPMGDLGSAAETRDSRPHAPPTFGEARPQLEVNRPLRSQPQKAPAKSDDFDDDELSELFGLSNSQKRQKTEAFILPKENTSLKHNQLPPINPSNNHNQSRRDSAARYYEQHARYKAGNPPSASFSRNEVRKSSGNSFLSSINQMPQSREGNTGGGGGTKQHSYKPSLGPGFRRDSGQRGAPAGYIQSTTGIGTMQPSYQNTSSKPLVGAIGGPSLIDKYHPFKF